MEHLALTLSFSPTTASLLCRRRSPTTTSLLGRRRPSYPALPPLSSRPTRQFTSGGRKIRISVSAQQDSRTGIWCFASISSSSSSETSTATGTPTQLVPPQSSSIGSPLFWIGVGVGVASLFSMVASRVKMYMMQQAFKTVIGQMTPQHGQNTNSPFFPGSVPYPTPSQTTPSTKVSSQSTVTVDFPATEVEKPPSEHRDESAKSDNPKKYAFVDVSPEEVLLPDTYAGSDEVEEAKIAKDVSTDKEVSPNGAAVKLEESIRNEQSQSRNSASGLSVDALEKMMEDPTVQKMVYDYLPEDMRNPTTFKWMLQNPQYRQQLQDMLNNMGGGSDWDDRMMESLKIFDLSSPEVKQQFEQIGLTPEEVISKIMANPDVAMAFQNPKVQAAIMECSQNPLSIAKYQNDKEVMDVFKKISELFPGVTGP